MKACKDCKHLFHDTTDARNWVHFDYCDCSKSKRNVVKHDYINGTSESWIERYMCSTFRELNYPETCGPDAKFFEPKTEEPSVSKAHAATNGKLNIKEFIIKTFLHGPILWLVLFLFLYACCSGCHAGVRRNDNIMRVEIKTADKSEIVKECYSEKYNKWDDGSTVKDPIQIGGCARFIEYTLIPFGTKSYNCKIYTLNSGTEFDKMHTLVHELKHCIDNYNEFGFKTQITPMWLSGEKSGE